MMATSRRWGVLAVVLAMLATGCAQPGEGGYRVSASFPRATALFEESRVKVMGVDVGHIERLEIDGDQIRADLLISDDVPLPDDVQAAIVPLTLIGERNVVLYPAYQPGDTRIEDGFEIPDDRTRVGAEPDDVLETVADLTQAIDAERGAEVVGDLADGLEGRGEELRGGIQDGARIAAVLREHHHQLLDAGETLTELSAIAREREDQLLAFTETYVEGISVLADEREQLRPLLANVERLMDQGTGLVDAFEETLATDLATLAETSLVLEANTASVQELINALPSIAEMLIDAHRPETEALKLRFTISVTLTTLLNQVLGLLGLSEIDCLPLAPDIDC